MITKYILNKIYWFDICMDLKTTLFLQILSLIITIPLDLITLPIQLISVIVLEIQRIKEEICQKKKRKQ